jgi:hypothetical protein
VWIGAESSGDLLPPPPPAEKATTRPDLISATRWARSADCYDAMDRDIVYPNYAPY